jgi:hypothetical protein
MLSYHLRAMGDDLVAVSACMCIETHVVFASHYVTLTSVLPYLRQCLQRCAG